MQFQATLLLAGKTATGIEVPAEVVEALGSGKRPAVRVSFNGYTYRTTIAPMGGVFMIPVSAEIRAASGAAAGDLLDVEIELDTAPREVTVPDDLAEGLAANSNARNFFAGLSYSHKRAYVLWIEESKKAETRAARVVKTLEMLSEGKTRS
jgi:Bacteriocin-protection, YdeI or OmpD-Associated/Domain of unknown function (DUF1905)